MLTAVSSITNSTGSSLTFNDYNGPQSQGNITIPVNGTQDFSNMDVPWYGSPSTNSWNQHHMEFAAGGSTGYLWQDRDQLMFTNQSNGTGGYKIGTVTGTITITVTMQSGAVALTLNASN